ncbi:hypothetical protein BN1110_01701 [bacterium YEK0313]|nr:hypothetical protein BN1110_01701 [bacterium YEK0313]
MTARPIGYWLKHLDGLIERQFERALADAGLSRRHWQVLNVLNEAPAGRADVAAALAPFWNTAGEDLDQVLDGPGGLATRGFVAADPTGRLALTAAGRAARAAAATQVEAQRRALLDGLTPEHYAETVRVLSVMAANAERMLAR